MTKDTFTSRNTNLINLVAERIKNQPIGELIKEEDLYDIVKVAMDKAFNTKVKVRRKKVGFSYNSADEYVEGPYSLIEQTIVDNTKERVNLIIKEFFLSREDEFKKLFLAQVEETINKMSVNVLMSALLQSFIQVPMDKMKIEISDSIRELVRNDGFGFTL